jgi:hypothetical protein
LSAHLRRNWCRRAATVEAGGGGRWRSHFGELAAWPGQQARGEATRSPRARWSSTCWRCKWPESGVHRSGSYGGRRRMLALARGEKGGTFIAGSRRLGVPCAPRPRESWYGRWHGQVQRGMGSGVRRPLGQWRRGGAPASG